MTPREVHAPSGSGVSERDSRLGASSPWPATLRRIVVVLVFVAAGTVVLALTNLHLALDSQAVTDWVGPRIESALNRPVTLGEAKVSLWPRPSLSVADVRIGSASGDGSPSLARVDRARLDIAWLPLVIGHVHVRRLALDGARLHMAIDEGGRPNFGDLVPSGSPAADAPAPLALRIGEVSVSDGSLTYFDAPAGRSMVVSGLMAEAALMPSEAGGWRTTVAARSDSVLVRIAGVGEEVVRGAGPTAILHAHGGTAERTVEIDEGHLAFAHDTLAVYGAISLGTEPRLDLLLTDEAVSASFLTGLFPLETRSELLPLVEGSLGLMVQLSGGADEPASLRGSVRLRDLAVRVRGEPLVDQVHGLVVLTPDTIAFDSVAGRLAGGPFEVSGTLSRAAGVVAFVGRGKPDLDAFDRSGLLPEGATLSGDASLYVSVVGPVSSPDSIEVVGVAELNGLQVEHARLGVPVYVPSGEVSLVGREARWSDLQVLLGKDGITSSGSVADVFDFWPGAETAPRIDVSLSAARLDLDAALPSPDTTLGATYAQLALAHLGGQTVGGGTAATVVAQRGLVRPRALPVHGTVSVTADTVRFRRYVLDGMTARFELSDTALLIPEARFGAWGGRVDASLALALGPEDDSPFDLSASIEGVRADGFLDDATPIADAISGSLDLELGLQGSTDASLLPVAAGLAGEMRFALADGRIRDTGLNMALADFLGAEEWMDVPFDRWTLEIGLEERILDIRESDLSGPAGAVVFSGPLRLDGSADLAMAVSIPPQHLDDVSLRRTGIGQSVLDRLRAAGGALDLGLRVSGWLQAPTLEPDASSAVALARR